MRDAHGLVAWPTQGYVAAAVDGAVARHQTVDGLHDVELAAVRPRGAVVDGVAEHPEGGPETALLEDGGVAEADGGFDEGGAVRRRGEGGLGFETA